MPVNRVSPAGRPVDLDCGLASAALRQLLASPRQDSYEQYGRCTLATCLTHGAQGTRHGAATIAL